VTPPGSEPALPGRILVVDDEAAVADVFRDFLTLMGGHEVETRPSGQAALDAFATFRPDVVLTDLNLDTAMSGLDLMRRLKAIEPELPVILVTGQVSIQSAIDALREGAYDYITKPCDLEELGQLLGRALAARRLTETNRELVKELTQANAILSRHESELRERIHVATWRMRTLFELSKEIAQDLGFTFRSQLACEKARQLTGGAASALFVRAEDGEAFRLRAASGLDAALPELAFEDGQGLCGAVAGQQTPVRRSGRDFHAQLGIGYLTAANPEGVLVVPLVADNRALGVLLVLGKAGGFTQDDEDILALFASSAAVALSNSMLFEKTLELERLKSDFVAVVSHELRTPLAVVIGNLELLSDDRFWKLEPQQAKFLSAASTNSHRLLHLINDILDFSKLEAASLPMTRSPNELGEVVRQAAENLRRLFEEREINLDVAIPEDLPLAEIDEQRIAQVLTNLISNAIKFSPAGAPVTVSVTHDGSVATVRVTDQGEGIRREDMPKLFKKFSQLDSKSTRKAGGTGLGLAISRGLIEAHGGAIWAESEPGQGSTFAFTLPLIPQTDDAAKAA
jgi:signal transduction histidine kinase/FixJ family two-component response regulator